MPMPTSILDLNPIPVYKVVAVQPDGTRTSIFNHPGIGVVYRPDEWTYPAVSYSRLFAFHKQASDVFLFAQDAATNTEQNVEIWQASAINPFALRACLKLPLLDKDKIEQMWLVDFHLWSAPDWSAGWEEKRASPFVPAPRDTVVCDRIRLDSIIRTIPKPIFYKYGLNW